MENPDTDRTRTNRSILEKLSKEDNVARAILSDPKARHEIEIWLDMQSIVEKYKNQ